MGTADEYKDIKFWGKLIILTNAAIRPGVLITSVIWAWMWLVNNWPEDSLKGKFVMLMMALSATVLFGERVVKNLMPLWISLVEMKKGNGRSEPPAIG